MYRLLIAALLGVVFLQSPVLPQEKGKTFLSGLKVGQALQIKEVSGRFDITLLDELPALRVGYKVLEVGSDYVLVEDATGITELRIPVYSIKSITKLKLPK